jgi:hypothetical protein
MLQVLKVLNILVCKEDDGKGRILEGEDRAREEGEVQVCVYSMFMFCAKKKHLYVNICICVYVCKYMYTCPHIYIYIYYDIYIIFVL